MGLPELNWSDVEKNIIDWIKNFFDRTDRKAVVGVSGGVDSATTLTLVTKALGPERVRAVILPSSSTPPEDVEDAKMLIQSLGIEDWKLINIEPILESYEKVLGKMSKVVKGNTMARIRMTVLYALAHDDGIVVGTGDKSELLLGYFTKYGDGGVDILPIGDLYKTWVRKLALHLGVPERIALKPSSPRLWPGQLAEDELGFSYDVADVVLYAIVEEGLKPDEVVSKYGIDRETVSKIVAMMKKNKHKLLPPPIAKITKVTAFEFAARMDEVLG